MKKISVIFAAAMLAALVISLLASCATKDQNVSNSSSNNTMPSFDQKSPPASGEQIALIETSKGTIKMKFFPQFAPETVKNFVELSKKGFFDGLTFHRVIPDFMIQGGDPLGNGTGGETYKGPKTTLPGEVTTDLSHIRGAVSMANKGRPESASSQFFIVQNKAGALSLDGGYTVFAQVFEGIETVDTIVSVKRDQNDKPLDPVIIKKVTIMANP